MAATHHSNGKRAGDILERSFYIDFSGGDLNFLSGNIAELAAVIDAAGIDTKATIAPHRFNRGVRVRIEARAPPDSDASMRAYTNGYPPRPTCAHSRMPIDLIWSGRAISLFQASHATSMIAS